MYSALWVESGYLLPNLSFCFELNEWINELMHEQINVSSANLSVASAEILMWVESIKERSVWWIKCVS